MKGQVLRRVGVIAGAVSAALLLSIGTQSGQATLPETPSWIGLPLTLGVDVLSMHDTESTQAELPGLGHKFELIGQMVRDSDPQNVSASSGGSGGGAGGNEGISATTTPATSIALAFRSLPPGIKITAFENQLGLKYFFVAPKTCGGGSPRVTLLVDGNGDGTTDFAAHGHVNPPVYTACLQGEWVYEDLTDHRPRWEITPGGAVPGIPVFPFVTFDALEAALTGGFPNHKIRGAFLVEDACSFFAANCGKSHYDLLTIENRTLEIWQDTVRR